MAKSIGMAGYIAFMGSPADEETTAMVFNLNHRMRDKWERTGAGIALHVLDLMAAAGVTPAEAAAQLRAGRTIEDVCAERIQDRRDRSDLAQNTARPMVILKPSKCGDDGCVKPYGHEGLCVDSTGQARATKEWLAKGAPTSRS